MREICIPISNPDLLLSYVHFCSILPFLDFEKSQGQTVTFTWMTTVRRAHPRGNSIPTQYQTSRSARWKLRSARRSRKEAQEEEEEDISTLALLGKALRLTSPGISKRNNLSLGQNILEGQTTPLTVSDRQRILAFRCKTIQILYTFSCKIRFLFFYSNRMIQVR